MRRDDILASLCMQLAMVEQALQSSPYIQGSAPSLADFALYGALRPLELVGEPIPARFPQLREWYVRAATV